jgi:hypothetical protein
MVTGQNNAGTICGYGHLKKKSCDDAVTLAVATIREQRRAVAAGACTRPLLTST